MAMSSPKTRRTFLKQSAAAMAAMHAACPALPGGAMANQYYLCVTCGTQFDQTSRPPAHCPICEDERQYIGWDGQRWTTLEEMRGKFHNTIKQEEPGLYSIHTQPKIGIGQRAFVVQTPRGNVLWDCVPQLDEATITAIKGLGGLAAIAISHPHYYTSMVEWSHAFGRVPIHLHRADQQWVMRPDAVVRFWQGAMQELPGGLTLIHTGGHFDGFQVLHWPAGAAGKGVLLSGDQPQVCQDRRWVSFLYSYPNMIPLSPAAIGRITAALKPHTFERLYGAFPGLTVTADAHAAVERSAARYLRAMGA
jgi:hypothetical protein